MSNPLTKAAFWPLLLSSLATPASAQPTSSGITVVASHLDDVLTLSGPFLVQAADAPRFADTDFDDTAWPLLKPNQLLDDAHLAAVGNGYLWVRLHLHILDAHSPLAIAIGHSDDPYTVYANGQPIASSAGMASHVSQLDYPFTIGLPRAREITVAIRFYHPLALTRLPLQQLQIGHMSEIAASTELTRIHDFDFHRASVFILALALLAFAAFSLILFLAQRQRPEYLWLALYCFCLSGWGLVGIGARIGMISSGRWTLLLLACFGYASLVCSLEFVTRFVRVKAGWPLRLVELTFLLSPFADSFSEDVGYIDVFGMTLWFMALGYFLVKAFRSGDVENKMLLPPFALLPLTGAWTFARLIFPGLYFPKPFHVGRLGVDMMDISLFLFLTGILAVVLHRFIRVTRDEQRASAEIEAARIVQQMLIPENLPDIPGYTITNFYQPAQEVGGDFFQIIPLQFNAALVVLGDVSGKGLQAAMTVSLLVGAVRAAAESSTAPGELLANLNRRLQGRGTGFTTCLILRIDQAGNLLAANAGHLQPYLNGHEIAFEPGLPLGLLPDATYPESHLTLVANQTLTLLTDGVVEATSVTKELFGFERTQSISRHTAQHIAAAAIAFGDPAPQADDITVLTLERLPA